MRYPIAIEPGTATTAWGVVVPDLPGCFSAGDTFDEAMENAPQAIRLYAEALAKDGRELPPPRALLDLRNDPSVAADMRDNMVALVPAPVSAVAAE
jgi:predicted RNase H-like HicB family nuclease